MYHQTITLSRTLLLSIIRDAELSFGGPANETVKHSEFVPACIARIERLIGALTPFEWPTEAQKHSLATCLRLPLCNGLESSGLLRQRAIEHSVSLMWSHLNAPLKLSGNMVEVAMDTDHA